MPSLVKNCCLRISQKWVFAMMSFAAIFALFAMRMCLSFTISKMVKPHIHSKEYSDDTCPSPNISSSHRSLRNMTISAEAEYFEWSEYTQGIILGSFYWGFVLSHVPGGMLAERFGGKHTLGLGVFFTALFTILTPQAISWGGSTALIIMRIVMGACEGTTQPALSVMMSQWVPAEERSKISSLVYMGANFGILFISLGLGPIVKSMDWPGVYYMFGGLGITWYLFWLVLCYNSPREHPFISEAEAKYLSERLDQHTHADAPPVPWRHLLASVPFWALVVASIGRDWGGYTMISDFPKYTSSVLKFSDEENGLLFLVMNTCMLVSGLFFSWLSDWLIEKDFMSRTNVRKLMGTIGMSVHGVLGIFAAYEGCNKKLYFTISAVSSLTGGAGLPGIKANVLDLSPNYAGTVMAISHGLAGLCGIAGPYVVGILVPNQTLTEWLLIFWIICIVTVVTNVAFVIFASGDVQEWNDPNFERKKKKKKNKLVDLQEVEKLFTPEKVQIVSKQGITTVN